MKWFDVNEKPYPKDKILLIRLSDGDVLLARYFNKGSMAHDPETGKDYQTWGWYEYRCDKEDQGFYVFLGDEIKLTHWAELVSEKGL